MKLLPWVSVSIFSIAAAACGGTVVFDEPVGAGGASGSPTGSPSGTSSSVGPASSSGGFDIAGFCTKACDKLGNCISGCVGWCTEKFKDGCDAETESLIDCLANSTVPDSCAHEACASEWHAFKVCAAKAVCISDTCNEANQTCQCHGYCVGANASDDCVVSGPTTKCACVWEGVSVGSCVQDTTATCNLEGSCCKTVFTQ